MGHWEIHIKGTDGKWSKMTEYKTFHEAMEALKDAPGTWFANWGDREIVKGDYSLIKVK